MLLKVDQYQLNNSAYNQVYEYYIHRFSTLRGTFCILFLKSNKYYALVFDDWDKAAWEGMTFCCVKLPNVFNYIYTQIHSAGNVFDRILFVF